MSSFLVLAFRGVREHQPSKGGHQSAHWRQSARAHVANSSENLRGQQHQVLYLPVPIVSYS